ncbi:MAG: hypothetical protein ACI976_002337 [Aureispira sp.]|jgi:hypothetical protein
MNLDHLLSKPPKPPEAVLYSYIDGSGNSYYITKNLIQYDPMMQKYSSSGFYDGGKAAKVALSSEQFETIAIIIQQVRKNDSDHILNRVKGSGQVHLHNENEHFILGYNTTSKKDLEVLFKKMITP